MWQLGDASRHAYIRLAVVVIPEMAENIVRLSSRVAKQRVRLQDVVELCDSE